MAEVFQEQKKVRKAKLVTPPNLLKKKTGGGGFDPAVLTKAQTMLEENTVDFKPIAISLVDLITEVVENINEEILQGEVAIEALIYPVMQLRAQGSMFHYPLITEIADILVNFLETIKVVDKGVLEIVQAHKMSLNIVISSQIKGESGALGKGLCTELTDACNRYYKARKS